ncbi:NPCBM/NEW2 domain-containing protein [Nocardia sp. NPDC019395]|uniref:NPCBM/NEW2 domain-containing protein n=1 Tax=Nocardia sp. NPDC019395 TaxID=3154686 RepID=UPI0033FD4CC5
MLVSGIGFALAIVGLVVTLLVGSASGEADSDTALTETTTQRPVSAPPAAVPPAAPAQQYLADMAPTGSSAYTGTITMNGVSYAHAIYQQFNGCNTAVSHTYDLKREWSRFSSVVGLADGGNAESVLQFEVIADGKSIYSSGSVRAGEPPAVDVSVAGVQSLTIGFTFVDGNLESCGQLGNGVWGDPALTK